MGWKLIDPDTVDPSTGEKLVVETKLRVERNVDERTRYGLTRHCLIFDFFKPVEIMLPRE